MVWCTHQYCRSWPISVWGQSRLSLKDCGNWGGSWQLQESKCWYYLQEGQEGVEKPQASEIHLSLREVTSLPEKQTEQTALETISKCLNGKKMTGSRQHRSVKDKLCLISAAVFYNMVSDLVGEQRAEDVVYLDISKFSMLSPTTSL